MCLGLVYMGYDLSSFFCYRRLRLHFVVAYQKNNMLMVLIKVINKNNFTSNLIM